MAYLAAFFAHLAVWLFMSLAMPHLLRSTPEPPLEQEIEWTDMAAFPGELPAGGQDKGEVFDIPSQETAELPEARPAVEEVITPEDSPELVTDEEPVVAATEKEAIDYVKSEIVDMVLNTELLGCDYDDERLEEEVRQKSEWFGDHEAQFRDLGSIADWRIEKVAVPEPPARRKRK